MSTDTTASKGGVMSDKMVGHIFRIEDGLIRRFNLR
jgi:hypothetical protein